MKPKRLMAETRYFAGDISRAERDDENVINNVHSHLHLYVRRLVCQGKMSKPAGDSIAYSYASQGIWRDEGGGTKAVD